MNENYKKYQMGLKTSLHISYDTKEALDNVMIKMGKKLTYEKVVLELINSYLCNTIEVENIDNLFNDEI